MKLSTYEQETVVVYNNEESTAIVETMHKPLLKKLRKLCNERDDISVIVCNEEYGRFNVPKTWIKVSPPKQMNLSDEQRAVRAERMKNARASKGGDKSEN